MDFHILEVKETKHKLEKNDEICQMLVSGALDDSKTIGKAGADIFTNNKSKFSTVFSQIFPHVCMDLA